MGLGADNEYWALLVMGYLGAGVLGPGFSIPGFRVLDAR
jgi:hypothetical protein